MRLFEAVVLGLVQGLTEFLPVSSSAHLRLVPAALGWDDPGASFTAIVQLGTVAAVVLAFREELSEVSRSAWRRGTGQLRAEEEPDPLVVALVIGTVPIAIAGLVLSDAIDTTLRSLGVIAAALLIGSAWLAFAIARGRGDRPVEAVTTRDAVWIGVAQAASLLPGVSRSGATIGAGMLRGFDPTAATRLSFLLSVPAITLAGLFGLRDLGGDVDGVGAAVATVVAFASGYWSIRWLLRLVARGHLGVFIVYRCALAGVILVSLAT